MIYKRTGKIIIGYNNIYEKSQKIELPQEYRELLDVCYKLRTEKINEIDEKYYFRNISFGNKYVIEEITENKTNA